MSVDTALIFAHDARSRLQKRFNASIPSPAQTHTIPPGRKSITIVKHLFLLPTQISSMTMISRSRRRGFPDVFCGDALSMPQTIPSLTGAQRAAHARIFVEFQSHCFDTQHGPMHTNSTFVNNAIDLTAMNHLPAPALGASMSRGRRRQMQMKTPSFRQKANVSQPATPIALYNS